jgi:hypothetical protein
MQVYELQHIFVEALGIEERWREVGFGGSRGVSFAKSEKISRSRGHAKKAKSISVGLAGFDCSNEVSRVSKAIVALEAGDTVPARTVLGIVLEVLSTDAGTGACPSRPDFKG